MLTFYWLQNVWLLWFIFCTEEPPGPLPLLLNRDLLVKAEVHNNVREASWFLVYHASEHLFCFHYLTVLSKIAVCHLSKYNVPLINIIISFWWYLPSNRQYLQPSFKIGFSFRSIDIRGSFLFSSNYVDHKFKKK